MNSYDAFGKTAINTVQDNGDGFKHCCNVTYKSNSVRCDAGCIVFLAQAWTLRAATCKPVSLSISVTLPINNQSTDR